MHSHKDGKRSEVKTEIPYFEFITQNINKQYAKGLQQAKQEIKKNIKERMKVLKESSEALRSSLKAIKTNSSETSASTEGSKSGTPSPLKKPRRIITPMMADKSALVSNDQFAQIISCVPDLYQMFEWKLIYSNIQHGTSFSNLMRRANSASPFIIIIKDCVGNILGAYGSDKLKFSQTYYGTGESFIYTFKKSQEIHEFPWSKKNDLFINVSESGIMFGAGPFYGLWIDNELSRGRTHACDTFNNEPLSDITDFEIRKIEVWSVIDPFAKK
jgi:hypothetical protein